MTSQSPRDLEITKDNKNHRAVRSFDISFATWLEYYYSIFPRRKIQIVLFNCIAYFYIYLFYYDNLKKLSEIIISKFSPKLDLIDSFFIRS